jgi:quercetin dioxygenase-like cupin family protein
MSVIPVKHLADVKPMPQEGRDIYWLLTRDGCTNGCSMALGCYNATEFVMTSGHKDQEGFYVLEGSGYAKIGDEIIRLTPGTAFLVPPGYDHGVKRDPDCECVKAIFFHAAA